MSPCWGGFPCSNFFPPQIALYMGGGPHTITMESEDAAMSEANREML